MPEIKTEFTLCTKALVPKTIIFFFAISLIMFKGTELKCISEKALNYRLQHSYIFILSLLESSKCYNLFLVRNLPLWQGMGQSHQWHSTSQVFLHRP